VSHGGAADGGGGGLRADTAASVTGSSGGGVLVPPPDREVARRRTRSRPEPARPGARPGGTLVLDAFAAVRPAHPRDRRPASRVRPDTRSHRGPGPAPQRTGPAPRLRPPPGRVMF